MTAHDPVAAIEELLLTRGVPQEDIEQAKQAGTLPLLALTTAAIAEERRYTLDELAAEADMTPERAERFWRAMGFPAVRRDERWFTDADKEALGIVRALIDLGLTDEDVAVQMTRVIGSSMARLAEAQVEASASRRLEPAVAELAATAAVSYLTTQAWLLEYVWRRHFEAAGRRQIMSPVVGGKTTRSMTVGFADLVGFTSLSQQMTEGELGRLVHRFEEVAHDTVTALGGRVPKMIGDEAMFVVDDPQAGVEIGLRLSEQYADDELLSDVRVGVAYGAVLPHEGDYYGPTVNLASRIVGIAYPGTVVASPEVRDALAACDGYAWRPLRVRNLKDIGRVQLWHVTRPEEVSEARREVSRRRRARTHRIIPDLQRLASIGREFVEGDGTESVEVAD